MFLGPCIHSVGSTGSRCSPKPFLHFESYCDYRRWLVVDLCCHIVYFIVGILILLRIILKKTDRDQISYLDPVSSRMRIMIPCLCVCEAFSRITVQMRQLNVGEQFAPYASMFLLVSAAIHFSIFGSIMYARAKSPYQRVAVITLPTLCILTCFTCDSLNLLLHLDFASTIYFSFGRIMSISVTNFLYFIMLAQITSHGRRLFDSIREEEARRRICQIAHVASPLYCLQLAWRLCILSDTIEYGNSNPILHVAVYFVVESCPRLLPAFVLLYHNRTIWPRRKPGTLHAPLLEKVSDKESQVSQQLDIIFGPLPSEVYIDFSELELGQKVAQGGGGYVYKAYLSGTKVAAKALVSQMINQDFSEFEREARMLQRVHHPHVVTFYGIAHNEDKFYIVTEYCPGDFAGLVKNLSTADFYRYAIDLVETIQFLHRREIAHRDLKPANILVDGAGSLKICDLGLATLCTFDTQKSIAAGTPAYMPPEVAKFGAPKIDRSSYDIRAWDIYSLGMIYWYMWYKVLPFAGLNPYQILFESSKGIRPEIPYDSMPRELETLIRSMWDGDYNMRPTAEEVVQRLQSIQERYFP